MSEETLEEKVKRLETENIGLIADIETYKDLAYIADPHGMGQRTAEIIRDLRIENQQLKSDRNRMETALHQLIDQIMLHYEQSKTDYQHSKTIRDQVSKQLNDIVAKGRVPYPARIWVKITAIVDNAILKEANTLEKTLSSLSETILADAMPQLNSIIGRTRLISWWDARNLVASLVIGHSEDPKMICYEIVRELRAYGKSNIETVSRLSPEWIRETLGRNVTPEKLHHGINHAYQFRNQQRLNQGQYAVMHQEDVGSESNLRLYIGYLKKIEEQSEGLSDVIRDAIDTDFDK